jgi:hypothetical protein
MNDDIMGATSYLYFNAYKDIAESINERYAPILIKDGSPRPYSKKKLNNKQKKARVKNKAGKKSRKR